MSDLRVFEQMVAANPDRMSFVDAGYVYREVNQTYLNDHRCRREDIIGKHISAFLGQEGFERVKPLLDACLAGTPARFQTWFDFAASGRRYMDVVYYPYREPDRTITGVVVTARDCTEQRIADEALTETKARLDVVAETIGDVVWFTDMESHRVLFVSAAYERIWGRSIRSLYENPLDWMEAIHPDDRKQVEAAIHAYSETGAYDIEYRIILPDGSVRWIGDRGFAVRNLPGPSKPLVGIAQDITARKELEQALTSEQDRLNAFLNSSAVIAWMKDADGRHVYVSSNYDKRVGGLETSRIGKTDFELWPREIADAFRRNDLEVLNENRATEVIEKTIGPDGSVNYWMSSKFPFRDKNGNRFVGGLGVDVTQRVQLEQALDTERRRLKSFLTNSLVAAFMKDQEGRYVFVNDALLAHFGSKSEDWIGRTDGEIWPGPDAERIRRNDLAVLNDGKANEQLERTITVDGRTEWWLASKFPFVDANGDRFLGGLSVNVTDRVLAQEERQKFVLLAERSQDFIGICDNERIPIYVNPAGRALIGLESPEAIRKIKVSDFLFPEDQEFIRNDFLPRVARDGHGEIDVRFRHLKTGAEIWMRSKLFHLTDSSGQSAGWGTISLDLTEQRRAAEERREHQERLAHSQKLEAVGKLAAGMAHDVNSLFMIISGNAEIIESRLHQGKNILTEQKREALDRIMDAVDRGKTLLNKLMLFGRLHAQKLRPVALNSTVQETMNLIQSSISPRIRMNLQLSADLWPCNSESSQLLQVVMNLILNANDAMPEGGVLTVSTKNVELSPAYAASHADAHPGPHVLLSVQDTGVGMDPDTMNRVLEPYFSTKPVDKGSGLGLSIVHAIVKQARGHMTIASEVGNGSEFRVYLPAVR